MKSLIKLSLLGILLLLVFICYSLKDKMLYIDKNESLNSINPFPNSTSSISGNKVDDLPQTENSSTISADKIDDMINDEKIYTEKSFEHREIKIYVLGKDSCKNKMAILGSMHGDEPQGKYIIEQLMEYVKRNPEAIENKQILFIPNVNPDGLFRNKRGNANNVDLNRNFPTKNWGSIEEDKNTAYFPGSAASSEPETRMIIKYIGDFNPELIINIHAPLKLINYDGFNSERIARLMAKYNKYKTAGDIGYPTPGSFGTYFGKERNIPVITLETGNDKGEKAWQENKESILSAIQNLGKF
ncbi:MAG: DUF2817 domain-containing protein [Clostridiaceae bacterium]|nr:DUF2817 domain-containing protein [Clostridiaceae bacterium]